MERRAFLATTGAALATLHPEALARTRAAVAQAAGRTPEQVAADEDFWFQVRHAFTIDRNSINLNSGSVSPAPRVVQRAMEDYLRIMNMSPALYVDELLIPQRELVRSRLAEAFGCSAEEIAITRNTTEALETVQLGLDLKPGDEVLTTTQDYPSMLATWRQRERRDGIVLRTVPFPVPPPSLDDLYDRIEQAITPRTRVIMICHVTYTTGQIFPVGRICGMARERGIETMVDGAHGFAHFPFRGEDLGCDYYGTSLHKWLTAPVGTGFLYVRREKIGKLWPLMGSPAELRDDIRKFEWIGTHPVANRNAVSEALAFWESLGAERKAARLRHLRLRWVERVAGLPGVRVLTPSDPDQACGLGAMSIDGVEANTLTDYLLEKHQIHVRPRFVPDEFSCIRVTPNVFTTLGEIDAFSEAIEAAVRELA
jgi:selenocysteine lyase/cysteine desulfurase